MAGAQVGREQILAFRAARHALDRRRNASSLDEVAGICGIQDTPPGNAAVSLAARLDLDRPPDTGALLTTWSMRGAPHLVPLADHAVFTLGVRPADGTLEGLWGQPERALVEVERAMFAALRHGPRTKAEVSSAVTAAKPELASFCRPCDVHHPNESVFRAAPLLGRIVLASTAPVVLQRAASPAKGDVDALRTELLLRYLRCYAPTTPGHFAEWAWISKADAKQRWAAIADAVVKAGAGYVLEEDLRALTDASPPAGVRLLPNKDAFLQARDRDVLFSDAARRKKVFPMLGGPGVVLHGAQPVGTWRGTGRGKRYAVTVEPFGRLTKPVRALVEAEAERIARVRGHEMASVAIA